ncbi:MAG: organomercurial lyase [Candidatus Hodarchaeales archaeon]|jgi:hypothetical protein
MKEFEKNYSNLDENALRKTIRYYIYCYFIKNSRAPILEEISAVFQLSKPETVVILNELEELHHLKLIPGVSRILMAWPFSNISTQYKVISEDGKEYFANCAWDAIAFHIVLNQSIEINSYCNHCTHLINLGVTKDSIITKNPESTIVNFIKPISQWMDNVIDTCGNTMNFFYSEQHLEKYQELNPDKPSFTFTDKQIISLSKLIYTNRAGIDYERPNTEKMKSFLKREGLTGEFWSVDEYH